MRIKPFKLEEFWNKYEFTTPYLLCCSDAETWSLEAIIALADLETKELWQALALGYTEPPGATCLRKEISSLYSSLEFENICTFAGAEEGIYCTMRVLVEPGDHIIIVEPAYQSLVELPRIMGGDITTISLRFENNWALDLEEVIRVFRDNTKLIVLNYPHNPTGAILTQEVQDGLIALARTNGAYIFSDEVYRFLEINEEKRLPSIGDAYERGISLNVMSKSFGLAGLRIGWVATKDRGILEKICSYKLYTSICNSAPSEILAIMALRQKEYILSRNRKILLENLSILEKFVQNNQEAVSWVAPQGGTMALLKLLLPMSVEAFTEKLIKKQEVLVMPGSVFDLPGNFFRIGFGKTNMPAILSRVEDFLIQAQYRH